MKLHFPELPPRLARGLALLEPYLPVSLSPEGIPVHLREGDCLELRLDPEGGEITYAEAAQFYRAIAHIGHYGFCALRETPCFARNGVMVDASRNGVPTADTLKTLLCRMALMGLNLAMLYTEDTYEVEGQPFIGYLRGRYTKAELRELDDFAFALGIEMIPCIQTLAHFERVLQWPQMWYFQDTESVSLVGEEESYKLLEDLIRNASEPYRSRRIHIGMDEAWDIGLGRYLRKNGYRPASEILKEHLGRVAEIVRRLGLEAMMWSDMYFRAASPGGEYYEPELHLPGELVSGAPEDISLVYWDYFHQDSRTLNGMLGQHKRFAAPTVFAGGLWTWGSPAPNPAHTLATTLPALEACQSHGVSEVFATAWGDDGAECPFDALYYGLFLYAEYGYTGRYDETQFAERFRARFGLPAEAWQELSDFAEPPGSGPRITVTSWMCKHLLYEDPLLPLWEDGTDNALLAKHYGALAERYALWAEQESPFALFFRFYQALGALLGQKCALRGAIKDCMAQKDRAETEKAACLAGDCAALCRVLHEAWHEIWFSSLKPNGFEVIDNRMGALQARFATAERRLRDYALGRIRDIPELEEEREPIPHWDGQPQYRNQWRRIVSPGIV